MTNSQSLGIRFGAILLCLFSSSLLAQAQNPATIAKQAYDNKDYALSATKYVEALEYSTRDASHAFNAACSFALDGQIEKGIEWLGKAIQYGFIDAEHIKADSDLTSLRDSPEWNELVALAESKAAINERRWSASNFETDFQENLSDEEKVAGLSKVWAEVKFNFINFDLVPDIRWDSLYFAYLPKVTNTKSTKQYYKLLTELIAQLNDAHTNVYYPNELGDEVNARPAIRTRLVEDKVLVIAVYDSTLLGRGIAVGQEVLSIDGQAVKQYAAEHVTPYQSASTPQDRDKRAFDYGLLSGSWSEPIRLGLRNDSGADFEIDLERLKRKDLALLRQRPAPFEFEMLENNVALVKLNSFSTNKAADDFTENFEEISKADAIIFDVRENGGGNSGVGWRILSYLTDKPLTTSAWYTMNYRPAFRAWGRGQSTYGSEAGTYSADSEYHYKKPVVVLTSPRSFSAAEDFAVAFDAMDRGPIIGEKSGGSTGQPLFFMLPGNGRARVCTKRDYFPGGLEFVGIGVQPDIEIAPGIEDFRAGRDTVLERALEEAGRASAAPKRER